MQTNTRISQKSWLYLTVGVVVVITGLPIHQVHAGEFKVQGQPFGSKCKDFDGRAHAYGKNFATTRINYSPNTADKLELTCTKREDKGCISSKCIPKSTKTGEQKCQSLFRDEANSDKMHSIFAYQESCSSTHEIVVCCQKDSFDSLLIAGYGAEPHEFPHQVQLVMKHKINPDGSGGFEPSSCGGTIFNENYILTAAHCVVDKFPHPTFPYDLSKPSSQLYYSQVNDPDQIEVVVGTNTPMTASDARNRYRVEKVIVHEDYAPLLKNQDIEIANKRDPTQLFNDVALLKIKGEIKFNEYTKALKVAPPNFRPEDYADKVVIEGWGTSDNLETSEFLHKSDLKLRDESAANSCRGVWQSGFDAAQHICVGGVVDGDYQKTAGGGDSGGPAICRGPDGNGLQCGITSFGGNDTTCQKTPNKDTCQPSVYAEVSYFLPWIMRKTGGRGQNTGKTQFHEAPLYGINSQDDLGQVKLVAGDGKSCGGTLVSANTIVTASHCVFNGNGESKKLVVKYGSKEYYAESVQLFTPAGNTDAETTGMNVVNKELFDTFTTTKYDGFTVVAVEEPYYDTNVAVVKLATKVTGARPVSLSASRLTESDAVIHEAAWMRNSTLGLRKFPSSVISNKNCKGRFDRFTKHKLPFPIQSLDVCMVEKYSGGNSCDRDIGGGVFCGGPNGRTLCGVQVFRMCDYTAPKIIADIYLYSNNINSLIQKYSV